MKKKEAKISSDYVGTLIGIEHSKHVQVATNVAVNDMGLLRRAARELENVDDDLKKGNVLEYLEAAKFNRNQASLGKTVRAQLTRELGRPTDPIDIELRDKGKLIDQAQLKASDSDARIAYSFKDAKYRGAQRVTTSDSARDVKEITAQRAKSGSIHSKDYEDSRQNINDGLTDRRDGTSSGGTTKRELSQATENPNAYATHFEVTQYAREVGISTVNAAAASAAVAVSISSLQNLWEYCRGEKDMGEALGDIGNATKGAAIRGAFSGGTSAVLRIVGVKANYSLLKDTNVTVALASGVLDAGTAVLSFTRGEIDAEQFRVQLQDTTMRTVSTIYFTKAVSAATGAFPIAMPFVIYTVASYGVAACRAIISEARLNAEEYNRVAALYVEYNKQLAQQRTQLESVFADYLRSKQKQFTDVLDVFEYNFLLSQNYDYAICVLEDFAADFGSTLKYVNFHEFDAAMQVDGDIVL